MSHISWGIAALFAILISTIPAHAQAPSCVAACQQQHDSCIVACSSNPNSPPQGPQCAKECASRHSQCDGLCKSYPDRAMPPR
jgi:hypothetical protein